MTFSDISLLLVPHRKKFVLITVYMNFLKGLIIIMKTKRPRTGHYDFLDDAKTAFRRYMY